MKSIESIILNILKWSGDFICRIFTEEDSMAANIVSHLSSNAVLDDYYQSSR